MKKTNIKLFAIGVIILVIGSGCLKEDKHPEYPFNIIGAKIEFTITSCNGCGMQPGHRVIYEYGSSGQVQGFNTQDNNTISVDSYSYSRASNKRSASVRLNYHNGVATEDYDLSSSDDNWMEGSYEYTGQTPTAYATARGTYRVICSDCASFSGGSSGTGTNTNSGRVSFFTKSDFGCGNITINVQNQGSKILSQFHSNGISNCDAQGAATFELTPGQYTFTASCGSISWGPTSFTVYANLCKRYELK